MKLKSLNHLVKKHWKNVAIIGLVLVILCVLCCDCRNLEGFASDEDKKKPSLCLFYAPWCHHCKNMMPDFDRLKKELNGKLCSILKINCDENKELAKQHGIEGFPTIKFLPRGVNAPQWFVDYDGERNYNGMKKFTEQQVSGNPDLRIDQGARTDGKVPPSDARGAKTTSYVARHLDMA
jgi:protein disulfide-isomerase-like protein